MCCIIQFYRNYYIFRLSKSFFSQHFITKSLPNFCLLDRLFSLSIFDRTITPLPLYIYKIVYKLFNQNPLLWKFFIIFVCWMFCIRKKNLAIVRSCQNACILLHCKTKNKTKLSNFALRYDKRKTNRR